MESSESLLVTCKAFALLIAATAPVAVGLWYLFVRPRPLLPPQRHRSVSWDGLEICLAVFFSEIFVPVLVGGFIGGVFFAAPAEVRQALWTSVLSFPFQIASILVFCFWLGKGWSYQLGLDFKDFARRFALGWLFWVGLAPLDLLLNAWVDYAYSAFFHKTPEKHPIEIMADYGLDRSDWQLIFIITLLLAPFFEELLFRGVMQPWFAKKSRGGDIAMGASLVVALLLRIPKVDSAAWSRDGWAGLMLEAVPVLFVVVMFPVYLLASHLAARRMRRPEIFRGIFGTSMLFAMFHAHVRPTPIPLFFFAVCVGYLAYRTQSIVPGMVVHSLFNGVAMVTLVLSK